jgi:hypothetical protein
MFAFYIHVAFDILGMFSTSLFCRLFETKVVFLLENFRLSDSIVYITMVIIGTLEGLIIFWS